MELIRPDGVVTTTVKTIGDVIAIGKANGMSEAEAQVIEDWYTGAIARRKVDAGISD
jgi:hypothetical protein